MICKRVVPAGRGPAELAAQHLGVIRQAVATQNRIEAKHKRGEDAYTRGLANLETVKPAVKGLYDVLADPAVEVSRPVLVDCHRFLPDVVFVRDDLSSNYEASYNVSLTLTEIKRVAGERLAALPVEPDEPEAAASGPGCLVMLVPLIVSTVYLLHS